MGVGSIWSQKDFIGDHLINIVISFSAYLLVFYFKLDNNCDNDTFLLCYSALSLFHSLFKTQNKQIFFEYQYTNRWSKSWHMMLWKLFFVKFIITCWWSRQLICDMHKENSISEKCNTFPSIENIWKKSYISWRRL